jgi:hypothetical protein
MLGRDESEGEQGQPNRRPELSFCCTEPPHSL